MIKYKLKTRTTIAELENTSIPNTGIYLVTYMKKIVYIGKSNTSISDRLRSHLTNRAFEPFGNWLNNIRFDWANVRLDVLEPPDDMEIEIWLRDVESALVRRHKPLFNSSLQ